MLWNPEPTTSVVERVFALASAMVCPVYLLWQILRILAPQDPRHSAGGLNLLCVLMLLIMWLLCIRATRLQLTVRWIPVVAAVYLTVVVGWAAIIGADLGMPGSPYTPAVFIGLMLMCLAGDRWWPYVVCWGNCALLAVATARDGFVLAFSSMAFPLIIGTSLLVAVRALLLVESDVRRTASQARCSVMNARDESLRLLEQAHWDTVVHDQVINVLRAASNDGSGKEPLWLASEADKAVQRLLRRPYDDDQSPSEVERRLRTIAAEAAAACRYAGRSGNPDDGADLPQEVCQAFLGAMLEAIRNVERHSGTDACSVDAEVTADLVRVDVRDDGVGFDRRKIPVTCMGITGSIEGRMALIGGDASVISRPGAGTTVSLEWRRRR